MLNAFCRGWWQESPVTRESAKISRKTIAQGRPDRSAYLWCLLLVCLFFCMRDCGRVQRPAFPAPSDLRGAARAMQNPAQMRVGSQSRGFSGWALKHDPEKCIAVFRKDHAPSIGECAV